MANQTNLRISREITQIQQTSDLSLAVACKDEDIRLVRAIIVGPPDTPYEYGYFEFLFKFDDSYPTGPPKVEAKTTNRGRTRFNPNIYAGGKVCLTILGTWQGQSGEEWSSVQGLESILLSIQSLMSSNPYENEPGYENNKSDEDKKQQDAYVAKIRHETIRVAVIQKLEGMLRIGPSGQVQETDPESFSDEDDDNDEEEDFDETPQEKASKREDQFAKWEPFHDLQKRRFLWYYESYLSTIERETPKHTDGDKFVMMPFEHSHNEMDGSFRYNDLARRLIRVKEVLNEETSNWAMEGLQAKERESSIAFSLQRQFDQTAQYLKQQNIHNVDVNLEEGNPFVWRVTYFGKSGTNMEGGLWHIKISVSPRFPDEQPRVKFENKIFHHRVSKNGVLCYFPKNNRTDEIKCHIEAIVQSLEEESPPFDPRTVVHPEATKLLWGTAEEKKKYGRLQRRSAQESTEEV